MISTNQNKCPICGTIYLQNQRKCKKCFWNLTIYSTNSQLSIEQIIAHHEYWAKNAYDRSSLIIKQRNILIKKMDELQKLKNEIFELKLTISALEKQIESLSNQESSSNLKQEILLELKSTIKSQVKKYCQELLSTNQDYQSKKIASNPNIVETEFIENKSSSSENIVNQSIEINPYEQYIIDQYYNNPDSLIQYAYKVSLTKKTLENIYLNQAREIIFQDSNQSDYWIIELTSGGFCLLPDLNLKINTNLKMVKTIFELENYQDHLSKNFKVIKTAKVNEINNQWLLIDKGILKF